MPEEESRAEQREEKLLEEIGVLEEQVAKRRAQESVVEAATVVSEQEIEEEEEEVVEERSEESVLRGNLQNLIINADDITELLEKTQSLFAELQQDLDAYSVEDDALGDKVQQSLEQAKQAAEALTAMRGLAVRETDKKKMDKSLYAIDPLLLLSLHSHTADAKTFSLINTQVANAFAAVFDHLHRCLYLVSVPDPTPAFAKMHKTVYGIVEQLFDLLAGFVEKEEKLRYVLLERHGRYPSITSLELTFDRPIE